MKLTIPASDIEAHVFSWLPDTLDARTYLFRHGAGVLCVDPNDLPEMVEAVRSWAPEKVTVVLTHEHFDHISGLHALRGQCSCEVICTQACAAGIEDPRRNLSQYAAALLSQMARPAAGRQGILIEPFSCFADTVFTGYHQIAWEKHQLELYELPGHARGGLCMMMDHALIFTGDNLIPGFPCVTHLPGGSKQAYEAVTLPFLRTLPPEMLILPGHFDGVERSHILL